MYHPANKIDATTATPHRQADRLSTSPAALLLTPAAILPNPSQPQSVNPTHTPSITHQGKATPGTVTPPANIKSIAIANAPQPAASRAPLGDNPSPSPQEMTSQ
jgi:hypothetical protein